LSAFRGGGSFPVNDGGSVGGWPPLHFMTECPRISGAVRVGGVLPVLEGWDVNMRIDGRAPEFERAIVVPVPEWSAPRRIRVYRNFGKRLLDIVFVVVALPIVLPVVAILAILIALDGHSPLYRQARLGRGGRVFTMWKLRTMVPDADAHLEAHLAGNPEARAEWDAYQKLAQDPRITPLGQVLRKTSLDELPQLWNVLKGDMSLVGPRPMLPEQRVLYPGTAYFELRPGVTGLWQISERNASTFAERAEFDALYARNLSLATDLRVLVATVGVVVRGTGR
jgi:lipopolysaccharide/colanic/teichoic acid biosynthesis glycosyltransferase